MSGSTWRSVRGAGTCEIAADEAAISDAELQALKAQPLERRRLRVADGRLHLALSIGIADPAGQRDRAVVREHVAKGRVEGRLVDVRREHAFLEVVQDDDADGAGETSLRAGPPSAARSA